MEEGLFVEGLSDGLDGGEAEASSGFDDGSDVGEELGAPVGYEAVGDLAEDGGGPEGLLGAAVGWRDRPIGHDDEEMGAVLEGLAVQLGTGLDGGFPLDGGIKAAIEIGPVLLEGAVGQLFRGDG